MGPENLLNSIEFTPSEQSQLESKIEAAEPGSFKETGIITKLLGDFLDQTLRNAQASGEQRTQSVERVAPAPEEQASRGIEALQKLEGIRPEVWEKLGINERLEVLQTVENYMAEIQERPPVKVYANQMEPFVFGYFDGESIYLNANHLLSNDVAKRVETTIHEGRHAYQRYAVENPGHHSDDLEVSVWAENLADYRTMQMHGARAYKAQPVEVDARAYASALRQIVYSNVRGL